MGPQEGGGTVRNGLIKLSLDARKIRPERCLQKSSGSLACVQRAADAFSTCQRQGAGVMKAAVVSLPKIYLACFMKTVEAWQPFLSTLTGQAVPACALSKEDLEIESVRWSQTSS